MQPLSDDADVDDEKDTQAKALWMTENMRA
jgi:hypothetical protein